MLKRDLRLSHFEYRAALSPKQQQAKSLRIAERCLQMPIWDHSIYHLFLSIPGKGEVDTSFLKQIIWDKGGMVAVPKMEPGRQLSHYYLKPDTALASNTWGVPEPLAGKMLDARELDVVFLPLLAFDKKGYRVGYGGGYYDRFLDACRQNVLKIGISYFPPVEQIDDLHPGDIPMDYCVTPEAVFSF